MAAFTPRKIVKRKLEEWDAKRSSNAIVHGVITQLSPIKRSKKDENKQYFNGQLSDGNKAFV